MPSIKSHNKYDFATKALLLSFFGMIIFWATINALGLINTDVNYVFAIFEGLVPLVMGVYGLGISKQWSGGSSAIGKSISYFSYGALGWGGGVLVESYYNIALNIAVPYPSLGDLGYLASILFLVCGAISLAKTTGAASRLRTPNGKIIVACVFAASLYVMYSTNFLLPDGGFSSYDVRSLVAFVLNVLYAIGDLLLISMSTIMLGLSAQSLGGKFKLPIRIELLSLFVIYIADLVYNSQLSNDNYFVGNTADLLYVCGFFLLSLGLALFSPKYLLSGNPH